MNRTTRWLLALAALTVVAWLWTRPGEGDAGGASGRDAGEPGIAESLATSRALFPRPLLAESSVGAHGPATVPTPGARPAPASSSPARAQANAIRYQPLQTPPAAAATGLPPRTSPAVELPPLHGDRDDQLRQYAALLDTVERAETRLAAGASGEERAKLERFIDEYRGLAGTAERQLQAPRPVTARELAAARAELDRRRTHTADR